MLTKKLKEKSAYNLKQFNRNTEFKNSFISGSIN